MNNFVALFMTLLCGSALAQHDVSVCKPYMDSGKPIPGLPKGYSVRTELNIVSEKTTTEVHEYFDASRNLSAFEEVRPDLEIYAIMNSNTNQFIYIEPAEEGMAKSCQVTDLDKFMPRLDQQTKESNIIRLVDALEYGKGSPLLYNGSGILRGEKVQFWKACVYDKAWQATFDVTWYFSADGWKTSSGTQAAPVRVHLVGKTTDGTGKASKHERIYDFSEWDPKVPDKKVFELHSGSYCKGIKQKKAAPSTPSYFSYGLETVSMGSGGNIRSDRKIYYNSMTKLFRMDYLELKKDGLGYGKGPLSLIHDFNSGVAYLIYKNRGHCNVSRIDKARQDATSVDSSHVRMKTSNEFFRLNKKNILYQGQRTVRGINCDVWIDSKTDWPKDNSTESIWEWSFSSDEVLANSGGNTELRFPVSLEIKMPSKRIHVLHNIYGVEEDYQKYEQFDISMCFDDLHRVDYLFAMHGSYEKIIKNKEDEFRNNVRMTLSIYAGISPIRISNIKIDYDSEDVIVHFSILDLPPVGGDVKVVIKGNNLQDAAKKIVSGISNRGLSIDIGGGKSIPLKDGSFQKVVNIPAAKQGKYKPGDMAGIGLGMLIVGIVVGGLLTRYIVRRRLDDKFKAVRFDSKMEQ